MVIDAEALKVVSFLLIMAGGFLGLLWLTDQVVQWAMDNGWFWYITASMATVILMSSIWANN